MMTIALRVLPFVALLIFSGCSTTMFKTQDQLVKKVAKKDGFINHFDKPTFTVYASQDIEDLVVYLPKDTTTLRVKMTVSNIEDVIYMKLQDESGFNIDKVLRRVDDIEKLGLEQDGYVYEPQDEKNVVTLQMFVPSIYLYEKAYKPKLIFSFKRNSRSVQESVNLYLMREKYSVSTNKQKHEVPLYSDVKEYCQNANKIDPDFIDQLDRVNTERTESEFLTEIRILCN